jgi:hypothetical protein
MSKALGPCEKRGRESKGGRGRGTEVLQLLLLHADVDVLSLQAPTDEPAALAHPLVADEAHLGSDLGRTTRTASRLDCRAEAVTVAITSRCRCSGHTIIGGSRGEEVELAHPAVRNASADHAALCIHPPCDRLCPADPLAGESGPEDVDGGEVRE